jgi:hypothetical protein
MEMGIRAGLVNLYNGYFSKFLTIRQLIEKYAPSSDNNDTESYIRRVAVNSGVDPGCVPDKDEWLIVASEMLKVENGVNIADWERLKQLAAFYGLSYYL